MIKIYQTIRNYLRKTYKPILSLSLMPFLYCAALKKDCLDGTIATIDEIYENGVVRLLVDDRKEETCLKIEDGLLGNLEEGMVVKFDGQGNIEYLPEETKKRKKAIDNLLSSLKDN